MWASGQRSRKAPMAGNVMIKSPIAPPRITKNRGLFTTASCAEVAPRPSANTACKQKRWHRDPLPIGNSSSSVVSGGATQLFSEKHHPLLCITPLARSCGQRVARPVVVEGPVGCRNRIVCERHSVRPSTWLEGAKPAGFRTMEHDGGYDASYSPLGRRRDTPTQHGASRPTTIGCPRASPLRRDGEALS